MRVSLTVGLSIIMFASVVNADVSLKSRAAQATYEFWRAQKCEKTSLSETQALTQAQEGSVCIECLNTNKTSKNLKLLDELNENLFFNFAAAKQVDILKCHLQKLKAYSSETSPAAQHFREIVVKDIAKKLPALRKLHKEVTSLRKELNDNERYLSYKGATREGNARALKQIHKSQEQLAVLTPQYAALYESIWSINDPNMASYLKKTIESDLSPEEWAKLALAPSPTGLTSLIRKNFSFNDAVLKKINISDQKDLKALTSQGHQDGKDKISYNLNQATKELLVKRGDTLTVLSQSGKFKNTNLSALACRLDARYGDGTEDLSNALLAGTMVFGGAGVLLKLGTVGKIGALLTADEASLFGTAGRVMMAASSGAGIALTLPQIQSSCGSAPKSFRTDSCDSNNNSDMISFEVKELDQGNCLLNLAFGAAFAYGGIKQAARIPSLLSKTKAIKPANANKQISTIKETVEKKPLQTIDKKGVSEIPENKSITTAAKSQVTERFSKLNDVKKDFPLIKDPEHLFEEVSERKKIWKTLHPDDLDNFPMPENKTAFDEIKIILQEEKRIASDSKMPDNYLIGIVDKNLMKIAELDKAQYPNKKSLELASDISSFLSERNGFSVPTYKIKSGMQEVVVLTTANISRESKTELNLFNLHPVRFKQEVKIIERRDKSVLKLPVYSLEFNLSEMPGGSLRSLPTEKKIEVLKRIDNISDKRKQDLAFWSLEIHLTKAEIANAGADSRYIRSRTPQTTVADIIANKEDIFRTFHNVADGNGSPLTVEESKWLLQWTRENIFNRPAVQILKDEP